MRFWVFERQKNTGGPFTHYMKLWIKDALILGILLWVIGYITSLVLFFSPLYGIMGWLLIAVFTPFTLMVTWWWFKERSLPPFLLCRDRLCMDGHCHCARLSFYCPFVPGNLLRPRCLCVLCSHVFNPGNYRLSEPPQAGGKHKAVIGYPGPLISFLVEIFPTETVNTPPFHH